MTIKKKIIVLFDGPVGLIFADVIARNADNVILWSHDRKKIELLNDNEKLPLLHGTFELKQNMTALTGFEAFTGEPCLIVAALSSRTLEENVEKVISHLDCDKEHLLAVITKGFLSSHMRARTQFLTFCDYFDSVAEKAGHTSMNIASVNGPSLLGEMIEHKETFLCVAAPGQAAAELKPLLENQWIHVEMITDRFSAELGGALKNPAAIACGIAEALPGSGKNLVGELMSRFFRETTSLAVHLGANIEVLLGRPGLADLVTTATSRNSRNFSFGFEFVKALGAQKSSLIDRIGWFFNPAGLLESQLKKSENLVEGAYVLNGILEVAGKHEVKMPMMQVLQKILSRKESPQALIEALGEAGQRKSSKSLLRPTLKRLEGLRFAKGVRFQDNLVQRILHKLSITHGKKDRLKRTAASVTRGLDERLKDPDKREKVDLPVEKSLWQKLGNSRDVGSSNALEELVRFYVGEIADDYTVGMREASIKLFAPLRFAYRGFLPGGGLPSIGGYVKETKELAAKYNLLYTPTHRSHLDSLEIAIGLNWLRLPLPRYAAGINLMSGPMSSWLLKSLGGYAVDRKRSRNPLYLECLNQYSIYMLESGIPSLVYPEGTRSRTGGIVPLKTGLLATAVESYFESGREVVVVPLALSYENVPEDEEFFDQGEKRSFTDYLRKRTHVYLDVCEPLLVSDFVSEKDPTISIADEIKAGWRRNLRILPNHIIASLLVSNEFELSRAELPAKISRFIKEHPGNYRQVDPDKIIKRGMKILKKRGFIKTSKDRITGEKTELLTYYATMATG